MVMFVFFVSISFFVGIDKIYQATLESDDNAKSQSDVASSRKNGVL